MAIQYTIGVLFNNDFDTYPEPRGAGMPEIRSKEANNKYFKATYTSRVASSGARARVAMEVVVAVQSFSFTLRRRLRLRP